MIEDDGGTSEVPEGWVRVQLDDICTPPQYGWTTSAVPQSDGIKLLRTTDISSGEVNWPTVPGCKVEPPHKEKYLLKSGDIVVSRAGSVGISYLVKDCPPAVFASYLIRFCPKQPIPSAFISFYMQTREYWEAIAEKSAGIAVPNVNATKLKALSVPLPPLVEQQRIVAKIEALSERLSIARGRLANVPNILNQFRQSVLAAACSGRLTADWRETNRNVETGQALVERAYHEREREWKKRMGRRRYRPPITKVQGELPKVPETWCWATFDGCALDVTVGHVGSMKDRYVQHGIPFLRSQNVRTLRFNSDGLVYITDSFDEHLSKSRLYGGEILVTRSGANTGDCCVYPSSAPRANCSDIVITRPLSILNAYYGAMYICSPDGKAHLRRGETGIAQPHFNTNAMRSTPMPLPPLAEQHEIVHRVEELFLLAGSVETRLSAGIKRTEQITQSMFAKAFAGELVETEADICRREGRDYEPASTLVKRIAVTNVVAPIGQQRRTRLTAKRKRSMQTIGRQTIEDVVRTMPTTDFSFNDLSSALPGDYEQLKETIFDLLAANDIGFSQYFDEDANMLRFTRGIK